MVARENRFVLYRGIPVRLLLYLTVATVIIVAEHFAVLWFYPDVAELALRQAEGGDEITRLINAAEDARNVAITITGAGLALWAVLLFHKPLIDGFRRLWRVTWSAMN